MQDVFVVDAVRTPIGKLGGSLSMVRPDDLAAHVIKALMTRNPGVNAEHIEDVVFGAANQAGEDNRDVARMALLLAALPITVGGVTVNRLCASGLEAIQHATRAIKCGDGDVFIAGGEESMTRAPFVTAKAEKPFQRTIETYDTSLGWRFTNKKLAAMFYPYTMGETGDNVAKQFNVSREEQDAFGFASQQKYFAAKAADRFAEEIVPVEIQGEKGAVSIFSVDEQPRETSLEKMAALKPAFNKDGTVTAGNASGLNDGAAAMLLVSEQYLKAHNLTPLARVVSMAVAGVAPEIMGAGPIPATRKALQRAGLTVNDLDLIELNEAFASQSIACIRELGLDINRVNVNGGAIAIGHPLGCSGVRISTTLLHEMKKRNVRYGLATMCIGVGQGSAVIYENLS